MRLGLAVRSVPFPVFEISARLGLQPRQGQQGVCKPTFLKICIFCSLRGRAPRMPQLSWRAGLRRCPCGAENFELFTPRTRTNALYKFVPHMLSRVLQKALILKLRVRATLEFCTWSCPCGALVRAKYKANT